MPCWFENQVNLIKTPLPSSGEIYFLIEDLSFIEIQQTLIPEETIFIVLLILNLLIFIYLTVFLGHLTKLAIHPPIKIGSLIFDSVLILNCYLCVQLIF